MTRATFQRKTVIALAIFFSSCIADVEFDSLKLSSPRTSFSAIEAGEKVFFVGGFERGDLRATRTVEVYDLVAQNMSSPILLEQPRGFITPVVIEPHIYFVGGVQYINPIFIYDPELHQLVDYGTAPTVVKPMQLIFEDSLLIVLGASGVDILDVQNKTWIDTTPLMNLLAELIDYALISHRGLVLVLGGYNTTSAIGSNSVWVYDVSDSSLVEYPGNVAVPFTADSVITSSVSNSVITIELNNTLVMLFHMELKEWRKESLSHLYRSYSLQDKTFLFNSSALITIDWNPSSYPKIESFNDDLRYVFMINDYVVYVVQAPDSNVDFYAYNIDTAFWDFKYTSFSPFSAVARGVNLQNWHVFVTTTNIMYGFNPEAGYLRTLPDSYLFGPIMQLIPAEEPNAVLLFEVGGKMTKTLFSNGEPSNTVLQTPVAFIPDIRLGEDFLDFSGTVMNINTLTQVTNLNLTMKSISLAYNDKYMVFMEALALSYDPARVFYKHVDVYNYVAEEWENSTAMPLRLADAYAGISTRNFYSAAAIDGNLVIWVSDVTAVYDPSSGQWSTYSNYTQSSINNEELSLVHKPVPVARGAAYMRTNSNIFHVFSATGSFQTWNQTSPAPAVESSTVHIFHQSVVRNDSRIYVTSRTSTLMATQYNTLYIYDVRTNTWEYEQLPNALSHIPIIVLAGDYLLALQNDGRLSYWDMSNRFWYDQQLDFIFDPAIVLETSANLTFLAGGKNQLGGWVDRLMVVPHASIVPTKPPMDNSSTVVEPQSGPVGLSEGELIAAIVVPVAAALIAAGLLIFFLVRRQKRRRGRSSTTIGLAGKYGQWFIPYENIKFGAQLGQGASGQVFKGTWNNTAVALKVSMTQANLTVIGELELMMQLRPHPNVIQLFGFSVHPETESIILVIEFCNGGSLDDVLFDATQHISIQQKVSWLLGIAKGIEHLHANNIVHRDIAARNVLLNQNEPKITDFGMSRFLAEEKQHGTTKSELGPIRWMSPESLRIKEYSNKSDIWSFGILMYEVIAQHEPHADVDPIEIGRLIRDNGQTPTIPSTCPTELVQIMQECWHVSADKRISIDKIVQQLDALQSSQ
jgi:predicted Ser/Thr protein kinase